MSRKSKSGKRTRQRGRDGISHELLGLLRSRGLLDGRKLVFEPAGKEKMSRVLLEFVEPYAQSAHSRRAFESLIAVAVVSWNCALLDERDCNELLDGAVKAVLPHDDKQAQAVLRQLISELVERKRRYFARWDRFILSYYVSEIEDGLHLSVVSTL